MKLADWGVNFSIRSKECLDEYIDRRRTPGAHIYEPSVIRLFINEGFDLSNATPKYLDWVLKELGKTDKSQERRTFSIVAFSKKGENALN